VLGSDEQLLAIRELATVESLSMRDEPASFGRLAVTTKRLLMMMGAQSITLARLEEIDDVALVTDRLLVMLTTGSSFTINTAQPRLLRVELAAARAYRSRSHADALVDREPTLGSDLLRR
jgi:hypothetical protein